MLCQLKQPNKEKVAAFVACQEANLSDSPSYEFTSPIPIVTVCRSPRLVLRLVAHQQAANCAGIEVLAPPGTVLTFVQLLGNLLQRQTLLAQQHG